MGSKSTPISQLRQPAESAAPSLDDVDQVINDLNHQTEQQEGQIQYEPDYENTQPTQRYELPPLMPPDLPQVSPPVKQKSFLETLLSELQDVLIVFVVYILLNFEPVTKALNNLIARVTVNVYARLGVHGLAAAVLFYLTKKFVFNK